MSSMLKTRTGCLLYKSSCKSLLKGPYSSSNTPYVCSDAGRRGCELVSMSVRQHIHAGGC